MHPAECPPAAEKRAAEQGIGWGSGVEQAGGLREASGELGLNFS
jgi:hypothetical protein